MRKIKVLIVEGQRLILEALTQVLSTMSEFEIIGAVADSTTAIQLCGHLTPDFVLLDTQVKPLSVFETLTTIRSISPKTKLISVSIYENPQHARRMILEGASGYITMSSHLHEIGEAILECNNGNQYMSADVKQRLFESFVSESTSQVGKLTTRELEIINYLKEGLCSKEIASKLSVATKTIEIHRYNMLRKLNLKNTASLIQFTHQNCL